MSDAANIRGARNMMQENPVVVFDALPSRTVGPTSLSERAVIALEQIAETCTRIADAVAPRPSDIVDTPYVARKLGQTTTWIAEMARQGEIPKSCIVPGTGNGKVWKFYRAKIDQWITSR